MQLPTFKLEEYLATREFKAPYMLGSSDAEAYALKSLLDMADEECLHLWNNLCLGYTETCGLPILCQEIAKMYGETVDEKNILCFAGAEEGIFSFFHALLHKNDHVIVVTPCYQSLLSIPATICSTSEIALTDSEQWQLDLQKIEDAIQENTKLIVVNFPHNPTGAHISYETQKDLIALAKKNNLWIFSDEAYRCMELEVSDRLPPFATMYKKALSLSVMSKAFGLAGLRIGWIACQDKQILHDMNEMKHYLSICNSAPSEILALIALRNQDQIFSQNVALMRKNIDLLDQFFDEYSEFFQWHRPKGGCIGFPKFKGNISVDDFANHLMDEKGVVVLPGCVFDFKGNHFRVGFGRKNMSTALALLKEFIDENCDIWRRF